MRRTRSAEAWPAAAAALMALALATTAAAGSALPSPIADHDVPAGEAHAVARARGWRFGAEAGNPASICRLTVEGGALVLSAAQVRGLIDATCDFVLFGGDRALAPGWTVAGLARKRSGRPSCGYRFPRFPVEGGDALAFHIRILAARGEAGEAACSYALTGLVLRGPAAGDWREAFGP